MEKNEVVEEMLSKIQDGNGCFECSWIGNEVYKLCKKCREKTQVRVPTDEEITTAIKER